MDEFQKGVLNALWAIDEKIGLVAEELISLKAAIRSALEGDNARPGNGAEGV